MPLDRYTLVGSNDTLCYMGSLTPEEKEIRGSNPQPKFRTVSPMLANTNGCVDLRLQFRLLPNYSLVVVT